KTLKASNWQLYAGSILAMLILAGIVYAATAPKNTSEDNNIATVPTEIQDNQNSDAAEENTPGESAADQTATEQSEAEQSTDSTAGDQTVVDQTAPTTGIDEANIAEN